MVLAYVIGSAPDGSATRNIIAQWGDGYPVVSVTKTRQAGKNPRWGFNFFDDDGNMLEVTSTVSYADLLLRAQDFILWRTKSPLYDGLGFKEYTVTRFNDGTRHLRYGRILMVIKELGMDVPVMVE